MAQELFSNILESARGAFRHLGGANIETLLLVAGGIALLAWLLLRR